MREWRGQTQSFAMVAVFVKPGVQWKRLSLSRECGEELAREGIKRAIFETIDESKDDIVAFLQKLISFSSVTGEEREVQEFIARKLKDLGLEVDVWEPGWEELKKH
ncbi:MAG: hypothetical protein ABH852_01490, partial [Methanobacteriota archaeon]